MGGSLTTAHDSWDKEIFYNPSFAEQLILDRVSIAPKPPELIVAWDVPCDQHPSLMELYDTFVKLIQETKIPDDTQTAVFLNNNRERVLNQQARETLKERDRCVRHTGTIAAIIIYLT